jgi:two-component system response regulator DevR
VAAVRSVAAGRSLLDARGITALLERVRNSTEPAGPFDQLTDQERVVLYCLGDGLTNRQISERMYIAEKTVKNLVSKVLAKLEVSSRTQAALAVQHEQEHRS